MYHEREHGFVCLRKPALQCLIRQCLEARTNPTTMIHILSTPGPRLTSMWFSWASDARWMCHPMTTLRHPVRNRRRPRIGPACRKFDSPGRHSLDLSLSFMLP
jgi:hypothetical protein